MNDFGWFGGNGGFYGQGTLKSCTHYHAPTVEDVLREFAGRVLNSGHQWGLDAQGTIAETADKLREAMRDE